jgi:hypothetical protein
MFLDKARGGSRRGQGANVALRGASGAVSDRPYYDFSLGVRNANDAMCVLAACLGEFVRTSDDRCADYSPKRRVQVSIVQVVGAAI